MQALGRGQEEIEVRVPNRLLSKSEFEEYLLRSNRNTGSWDYELLKDFDTAFLLDIGFDDSDLSDIWDDVLEIEDDSFDEEKEIKKAESTTIKTGDFFKRGKDKSVVFHPKPKQSKLHPTMKPIGLLRRLILNSTKVGDTVYDPFGGSGSTLIACEHTKRKCVTVEMDTEYCETIIRRWLTLTGYDESSLIYQ